MSKSGIRCKECGRLTYEGHERRRYCNECYEEILKNNINNNKSKYWLIPRIFNKNTNLSTKNYVNYFKKEGLMDWVDILNYYNLIDVFMEQLCKLISFSKIKYPQKSISFLSRNLGIDGFIFQKLNYEKIENITGLEIQKKRVTKEDIEKDFISIKNKIGYIPLYFEYFNMSRYSGVTCRKIFNSTDEPTYDFMVREFSTASDFLDYKKRKYDRKIENMKNVRESWGYSMQELKDNFVEVCNGYYNDNGFFPSSRAFDKISNIDSSVYRGRYKQSFVKIMEDTFGDSPRVRWKSERECLNLIASLISERYEPQKTFDWLVSNKGTKLRCDGYFPKANIVIEYHGELHREAIPHFGGEKGLKRRIDNDTKKLELLKSHGINPIVIWFDDDWRNVEWMTNKLKESNL